MLKRIRAGEKSQRSRRWEKTFELFLSLDRTCRTKRWGLLGWTWCSSVSSPASSLYSTGSTGWASSGYTRRKRGSCNGQGQRQRQKQGQRQRQGHSSLCICSTQERQCSWEWRKLGSGWVGNVTLQFNHFGLLISWLDKAARPHVIFAKDSSDNNWVCLRKMLWTNKMTLVMGFVCCWTGVTNENAKLGAVAKSAPFVHLKNFLSVDS